MPNTVTVRINKDLLVHCRECLHRTIDDVHYATKISLEDLVHWENGEDFPRLTQIRTLAKYYKKPLAFFLLPAPPPKPLIPKELRTLLSEQKVHFTYKTWLAFNHAFEIQSLAKQFSEEIGYSVKKAFDKETLATSPSTIAGKYRKKFGLTFEIQKRWKDPYQAFDQLASFIEGAGVLVNQASFPLEEARGFVLADGYCPVIVVNSKDSINARVFTLMHEFAHVLLNVNNVCFADDLLGFLDAHKKQEMFCNNFAANFLVPAEDLVRHPLVDGVKGRIPWDDSTLSRLARHFKVSTEVVLRRLVDIGLASQQFYKDKREEWAVAIAKSGGKKKGGMMNPPKDCLKQNGRTVVSLVMESYNLGNIRQGQVSEYLGVKAKHLPMVEYYLSEATAGKGGI